MERWVAVQTEDKMMRRPTSRRSRQSWYYENWEKENAVFQVEVIEQKRAPECIMEHNVDVPVPQIAQTERVKEVNQLITQDRISDCDKLAKLQRMRCQLLDLEQKAPRNVSWCCEVISVKEGHNVEASPR